MSYESLSGLILLVIVALGLVVWLPARTASSMRHVEERAEDRYSPSMHLIDASCGTRFSDERTPRVEGILMQQDRGMAKRDQDHIAHVRQLRRAAIRRRRIIVGALAVVAVVVLALAFTLHFSPWFALIPLALDAVVIGLGAFAARQAREWERRVARAGHENRSAAQTKAKSRPQETEVTDKAVADNAPTEDDAPTEALEKREIRRILRAEEQERLQAAEATKVANAEDTKVAEDTKAKALAVTSVSEPAPAQPFDVTTELAEVKPAPALDAFAMASNQDLISFSLGAPRNGVETPVEEPRSLEIKSTKQVSKATPVEETEKIVVSDDAEAFHATEIHAEVDAPVATSDSLSIGVEAILSRRVPSLAE